MTDKTEAAVFVFNKYAKEYQTKFMDFNLYHDTFDAFCDLIKKKNAEVLEVACGPGNITNYLLKTRPDLNILGIDLAENMIALAEKNNPDAEFRIMDGKKINKLNKTYDAILCGFGLPYFSKEETANFISDASSLLNPDGILYLSTMEDDYSKSGLKKSSTIDGPELFIYYHQRKYIINYLHKNRFKPLSIVNKDYKEVDGSITKDLIIISQIQSLQS